MEEEIIEEKKTSVQLYNEVCDQYLRNIKDILEGYYPGRWDIQTLEKLTDSQKEQVMSSRGGFLEGSTRLSGGRVYAIVIYFPEIWISNKFRKKHRITDLYLRICMDHRFRIVAGLECNRGTRTYAEYYYQYTHSHAREGVNGYRHMCLGDTELESLVSELTCFQFDLLKFEILIQQLEDYLSYESVDSGPYIYIKKLQEIPSSQSPLDIPTSIRNRVVGAMIKTRFPITISVLQGSSDGFPKVTVCGPQDYWEEISSLVPAEYLYFYDPIGNTVLNPVVSREWVEQKAKEIGCVGDEFVFQGKTVRSVVVPGDIAKPEGTTFQKRCTRNSLEMIINEFCLRVRNYIIDDFEKRE